MTLGDLERLTGIPPLAVIMTLFVLGILAVAELIWLAIVIWHWQHS